MDYPWVIHGLSMDYPSFRVGPIPRHPIRLLIPIKSYKREVAMFFMDFKNIFCFFVILGSHDHLASRAFGSKCETSPCLRSTRLCLLIFCGYIGAESRAKNFVRTAYQYTLIESRCHNLQFPPGSSNGIF